MRSLVSDLIPEYNKKLQFFLKRHWLMLWDPLFLLAHRRPMCVPLTYNHIGSAAHFTIWKL